jgi:hypothetical protein
VWVSAAFRLHREFRYRLQPVGTFCPYRSFLPP